VVTVAAPVIAWPPIAAVVAAAWGVAVVRALRTGNLEEGAVAATASGTGRFLAEAAAAGEVAVVPSAGPAAVEVRRAPAVRAVLRVLVVRGVAVVAAEAGAGKRR